MITKSNHSKDSSRQRIRDIVGTPLPDSIAFNSMNSVLNVSRELLLSKRKSIKEKRKSVLPFYRKLWELAGSEEVLKSFQSLSIGESYEKKERPILVGQTVHSEIKLGSVEAIFAPPYDYAWTEGVGDANYGKWTYKSSPASLHEMLADKKGGNLKVHNKVVLIDNNDAYAGLGIFYRPLTNGYKRFRFGGNWNNYWVDDSFILTANNYGFVGIYIVEFDPDGTNMKIIQDRRYPLWNDGTGWFEHHEDTVEGAAGGFESFPFYGSPEKRYICWAWCGCQVESDDENALGLLPAASFAEALLEIHISAMSIKEA